MQIKNEQPLDYFIIDRPAESNLNLNDEGSLLNLEDSEQKEVMMLESNIQVSKDTNSSELNHQEIYLSGNNVESKIEAISNLTVLEVSQQIEKENLQKKSENPDIINEKSPPKNDPNTIPIQKKPCNIKPAIKQNNLNLMQDLDSILGLEEIIFTLPETPKFYGNPSSKKEHIHKENKIETRSKDTKSPEANQQNAPAFNPKNIEDIENKFLYNNKKNDVEEFIKEKIITNIGGSHKTPIMVETPKTTPSTKRSFKPNLFKPINSLRNHHKKRNE